MGSVKLVLALAAVTAAVHVPVPALSEEIAPGRWKPTTSMETARQEHTAVRLLDGRVLVAGGNAGGTSALSSAELYRPDTRTWTSTGSMTTPRQRHTATLLQDGRVLVVGGRDNSGPVASAEIYDPASGIWSSAGTLTTAPRYWHTATLLNNGKVLVAGGLTGRRAVVVREELIDLNSAELWDPSTGLFTATGFMLQRRDGHSATLLRDGKVLAAGGVNVTTTETYDPATGTWSSTTGSTTTSHRLHGASLLKDGTVFVVGGACCLESAVERFDPATGSWATTSPMSTTRFELPSTVELTGTICATSSRPTWCNKVLVAAGSSSAGPLATAELYDRKRNSWMPTGSLAQPRSLHTTTALKNGKVLVTGGSGAGNTTLSSAEIFAPSAV